MSKFKELRKERGLTQEELTYQFNERYGKQYTASSISMFENGKRIPETKSLLDFADFFGVTVDYLLDGQSVPLTDSTQQTRYKELRLRRGLTQDEVATLMNAKYHTSYDDGAISQIESGKRTPETKTIKNFADFYNVSVNYLLGRDDNPMPKDRPMQLEKIIAEQELTYNGEIITQEDREKINRALELAFWDAKKLNKRKKG